MEGKKPDKAAKECAKKIAKKPAQDSLQWFAHSFCCEAYNNPDYQQGDPCWYGTWKGDRIGTPRKECWQLKAFPKIPSTEKLPDHPETCCDFRACVHAILSVHAKVKPDVFSWKECREFVEGKKQ